MREDGCHDLHTLGFRWPVLLPDGPGLRVFPAESSVLSLESRSSPTSGAHCLGRSGSFLAAIAVGLPYDKHGGLGKLSTPGGYEAGARKL